MKKVMLMLALCSVTTTMVANAYAEGDNYPALNVITLQLKSEQWLATKTALVTVAVNAAVNDQGVEKIQNDAMQKLSQIAIKTEWHIVSFNRQQDKSGLESVAIRAQARVAQSDLSGLRNAAKMLSKPGEAFTIDNIEFTPTEDETRATNVMLRTDIYTQARHEIDVLNATYPTQKYYLHQIDFIQTSPVMPMAANAFMTKAAVGATPLAVGNKAQLQATVVLASQPELPSNLPRSH
jgi:hypothetical protein